MSQRFLLSESDSGSSSLPASPLLSPMRREETSEPVSVKDAQKQSRNEEKFQGGNITSVDKPRGTGTVLMERNNSIKNKSATVDLGVLRRFSLSPEMVVPVKEKRGKSFFITYCRHFSHYNTALI